MDNLLKKFPNWARYLLAIPFGLVCWFIGYYIGYFSNLYIASPDSIAMKIYIFLYNNGINVLVMLGTMNYMLPKYHFQFTLGISVVLSSITMIGLGMSILVQNITISYILGVLLFLGCIAYCCYCAYKEHINEDKNELNANSKYIELSKIVMKKLNTESIDEAIEMTYSFYKEQGVDVGKVKIDENNKFTTLSKLVMLGLDTDNIDEAIQETKKFYDEQEDKEENEVN